MESFIDKILEIGAGNELACSEDERILWREEAEKLYKNHFELLLKSKFVHIKTPYLEEIENVFDLHDKRKAN